MTFKKNRYYNYHNKEILLLHGLLDINKYKIKNGFKYLFDYELKNVKSIDGINIKCLFELINNFIDILQYKLVLMHEYTQLNLS